MPSVNKLSTSILNYFAAFTETRFNFRTLINYRWTDNELTLDYDISRQIELESYGYRFCEWSWRGVNSWGR